MKKSILLMAAVLIAPACAGDAEIGMKDEVPLLVILAISLFIISGFINEYQDRLALSIATAFLSVAAAFITLNTVRPTPIIIISSAVIITGGIIIIVTKYRAQLDWIFAVIFCTSMSIIVAIKIISKATHAT